MADANQRAGAVAWLRPLFSIMGMRGKSTGYADLPLRRQWHSSRTYHQHRNICHSLAGGLLSHVSWFDKAERSRQAVAGFLAMK